MGVTYDQLSANYSQGYYSAIAKEISTRFNLVLTDPSLSTDNVCFANHPGIRPEFRQSFTADDLLNFLFAVGKNGDLVDIDLLPENPSEFWLLVEKGAKLKSLL